MARGTGVSRKSAAAVVVLVAVAAAAYWWIGPPRRSIDTSHMTVTVSGSDKFTRRQLDDAVQAVLDAKSNGCSIDTVSYDEAQSNDMLKLERRSIERDPGSYSTIYGKGIARYGADGMTVFQTDFTCGRHTFNPSSETGWCDYLAYDPDSPNADHGWVLIDSGTG